MSAADARFVPPSELIALRELAVMRERESRPNLHWSDDEIRTHSLAGYYDRHISDELAAHRPKEWSELCQVAFNYAAEHSDGYFHPDMLAFFAEEGWLGSLVGGDELEEILEVHPRFRPLVDEWGVAEWAT